MGLDVSFEKKKGVPKSRIVEDTFKFLGVRALLPSRMLLLKCKRGVLRWVSMYDPNLDELLKDHYKGVIYGKDPEDPNN